MLRLAWVLVMVGMVGCGDAQPDARDPLDVQSDSGLADSRDPDLLPGDTSRDADSADSAPDILYPGYACDRNDRCSTGLCYGLATPQGHFEPARCQDVCLGLKDFTRYCDSDDDCCRGRCCLNCGAQAGLCVLDP